MTARDWSSGSITKHRGRFRARLPRRYGRRALGQLFDTHQEAAEALAATCAKLALAPPEAPTLASTGAAFLKGREVRPGTLRRDEARWRCYVDGKRIGGLVPEEVTRLDVEEWLASTRKLAPQTRQNALCLLRQALDAALRTSNRPNPAAGVKLKRRARDTSADDFQWLRLREIPVALERAPNVKAWAFWTIKIYSGLRAGELCGLRDAEDVDDELGVLHVRWSRDEPTKGGKPRDVPMLAPVAEAIRIWRAEKVRLGIRSHLGLLFPARDGGYHDDGYDAGWYEAMKGTPLARASIHDCRHTCASHLLQGSWAPKLIARALRLEEVRDWLGHKDIKTTQRYAKLSKDAIRGLVAAPKRRSKRDTTRDTSRSRLGDLNSGPTVYEKVADLVAWRAKKRGSPGVSRAVSRLHAATLAAAEAVKAGDRFMEARTLDLVEAAADVLGELVAAQGGGKKVRA